MKFTFAHNNINVFNLDKSLGFYKKALNLQEERRKIHPEGDFILVYLKDDATNHLLELTWLKDRKEPYDLGDNEIHLALNVDDYDSAYKHHMSMNCICYENKEMGIYFISDPDGYWIEIIPNNK